jgi:uncharacterized protein YjbI with pentapeptide repeats
MVPLTPGTGQTASDKAWKGTDTRPIHGHSFGALHMIEVAAGVVTILSLPLLVCTVRQGSNALRGTEESERRTAEDARKSRHYQAWQTITLAEGHPGNAGRIEALEELNSDGVALAGVNLKGSERVGAFLRHINLRGADLWAGDLSYADLFRADLEGANLQSAILRGACLFEANLQRAELVDVDLEGAELRMADLRGAVFGEAFARTNFHNTDLYGADLSGAHFSGVSTLTRLQLLQAKDWRGADLPQDLHDLELPASQSDAALESLRFSAFNEMMDTLRWKPEFEGTYAGYPMMKPGPSVTRWH